MNIEYDKIYKAPYHNNGGDVCGYKVDKSDLDNILQMLRTAEKERDQYKAELDTVIGIKPPREGFPDLDKDHLVKISVQQSMEIEYLSAQLKESAKLALEWQSMENEKHLELESLRTKIKEAQEPIAVMGNNGSVLAKKDFSNIDDFLNACRKNKPLFEAPVIPD